MVLAPYAAVFLPFQLGLRVQAALIIAVLAVAASAWRHEPLERGRLFPRPVQIGLGLYSAAAAWGAAVGCLAGNPTRFVLSQFLAMALLPTAALAFGVRRDLDGGSFGVALAWAAVVALALHGLALALPQLGGDVAGHFGFDLKNGIGFGAVAPLLWLLGLGSAGVDSRLRSVAVPGLAAVLCLWAQSRGAWASVFVGTLALLLLMRGRRGRVAALAFGIGLVPIGIVVAIGVLAEYSVDRRVPSVPGAGDAPLRIESAGGAGSNLQIGAPQPFDGAALDVVAESRGDAGTSLWVWATFTDPDGRPVATRQAEIVGRGRWVRWESVLAAPPRAHAFRAGVRLDRDEGAWLVRGLGVRIVRSGIEALGRQLRVRAASLGAAITDPLADSALTYRVSEARAVRAAWSRAGLGRRLAGFGLGATFAFPNASFDDEGRPIVLRQASYIHDFYLFLGFKLGVVGALALAGLALVVAWTVRSTLASWGRSQPQWFTAAAAAGWVAYLTWSVTSPEIYDFRIAPLWGALVATCCREVDRRGAAPSGRGFVDAASERANRPVDAEQGR